MKTFVVLHELCKIWSLARFHYELLCNRGQDLIESYLLVNFPQSRSALLLVLSEQMNQYFCSSTMKKTVFVTHINTRIHRDVLSVCCRSRMECCEMLWSGVTAFWASPRFGHPHSHIPSVLGIPFSYYYSVLGIPRYPPGMPKSLAFWASPPKQFGISRENRKPFRDGFR